jgi:hypothetical protein
MKQELKTLLEQDNYIEFFKILTENYEKINDKGQFNRHKREYGFGKYDFDFKMRVGVWLNSEKGL